LRNNLHAESRTWRLVISQEPENIRQNGPIIAEVAMSDEAGVNVRGVNRVYALNHRWGVSQTRISVKSFGQGKGLIVSGAINRHTVTQTLNRVGHFLERICVNVWCCKNDLLHAAGFGLILGVQELESVAYYTISHTVGNDVDGFNS
jgi:hypothetical protein